MRTANNASQNLRQAETGLVLVEVLTNTTGTLSLDPYTTFRVRATGATTVTIDGILAMTMMANEIAIFNSGSGITDVNTSKRATSVTVVIGAVAAFVQVAQENLR